jgi:putative transposase
MTAELRRRGWEDNHKRVLRVMREENLLVQVRRYVRTTLSDHGMDRYGNLVKDVVADAPNQIWCADITYIRLRREFVYLSVLIDLFPRAIRGWYLGRDMTEGLVRTALEQALAMHGPPKIHHSDQGSQYASNDYVERLKELGCQISMASRGRPTENAYAERLIRTLKEEEVYLNEYEDYDDANQRIGRFLDEVYMTKRVHSRLGYLTPAEFEAKYRAR